MHFLFSKEKDKRKGVFKFTLLLAVFIAYFIYLSTQFDVKTGAWLSVLTWSFFVLCTPVADGGFLLDFPVRLIIGVRMMYTEVLVWAVAIAVNLVGVFFLEQEYSKTLLCSLFYKILTHPWPYWAIIILSMLGTFLSLKFFDDLMDFIVGWRKKSMSRSKFLMKTAGIALVFGLIMYLYYELLAAMGIVLNYS